MVRRSTVVTGLAGLAAVVTMACGNGKQNSTFTPAPVLTQISQIAPQYRLCDVITKEELANQPDKLTRTEPPATLYRDSLSNGADLISRKANGQIWAGFPGKLSYRDNGSNLEINVVSENGYKLTIYTTEKTQVTTDKDVFRTQYIGNVGKEGEVLVTLTKENVKLDLADKQYFANSNPDLCAN